MKNLFTAFNPRKPIIGEVGDKIPVFVRSAIFFDYKNAYLLVVSRNGHFQIVPHRDKPDKKCEKTNKN